MEKKLKIFLNYFVGPILFVWLSYSIYRQVKQQSDLHQSWELIRDAFKGPQLLKLLSVILLMLFNWGVEAGKWQLLAGKIQRISFSKAYRSVLAGQAFGFGTINRVGESAGRAVFLEEGNRLRGIVLSIVGSMSQLSITFIAGFAGLIYLQFYFPGAAQQFNGWLNALMYITAAGALFFLLFYFRISWLTRLLEKIPVIGRHRFFVQKLEDLHGRELTCILLLSVLRYVVFVVQYMILLQVFEVQVVWTDAAAMVCVMLLILAIIPTITLAELGFRGKVSIQLFGMLSQNTLGIIATAAGIWIINLIIPAICGTLFILGIRLFSNKEKRSEKMDIDN